MNLYGVTVSPSSAVTVTIMLDPFTKPDTVVGEPDVAELSFTVTVDLAEEVVGVTVVDVVPDPYASE